MKKIICMVILLLCSVVLSQAQELMLEFVDGIIEVREGNLWVEAYIGDTFSPNTVLRVGENTVAELSSDALRITLIDEGIYSVAELLEGNKQVASWKLGSLVKKKLFAVAGETQTSKTAVMGVRGAAADQEKDISWLDEEDENLIKGKELIQAEHYKEALSILQEGYDIADLEEEQKYLYNIGYCYFMMEKGAMALRYLSEVDPDIRASYFPDLVLVKGQLLLESLSFREAIDLFDSYLNSYPDGCQVQIVHFLKAAGLQGIEKQAEAIETLKKVQALNPSNELGIRAEEMIKELSS